MKRILMLVLTGMLFAFFADSASAQTVSARGNGVAFGSACDLTPGGVCPDVGGKGVKFSFDFSGTGTTFVVPVSGTWSASEPETGVQVQFVVGTANVFRSSHQISVFGTCNITTPNGTTLPGSCFFFAQDRSSNGDLDFVSLSASAGNGSISASSQVASGNMHID